jgi:hypothetical protein
VASASGKALVSRRPRQSTIQPNSRAGAFLAFGAGLGLARKSAGLAFAIDGGERREQGRRGRAGGRRCDGAAPANLSPYPRRTRLPGGPVVRRADPARSHARDFRACVPLRGGSRSAPRSRQSNALGCRFLERLVARAQRSLSGVAYALAGNRAGPARSASRGPGGAGGNPPGISNLARAPRLAARERLRGQYRARAQCGIRAQGHALFWRALGGVFAGRRARLDGASGSGPRKHGTVRWLAGL